MTSYNMICLIYIWLHKIKFVVLLKLNDGTSTKTFAILKWAQAMLFYSSLFAMILGHILILCSMYW